MLTVTYSTFSNNTTSSSNSGATGGGIANDGTLTITYNTFSNNTASSSNWSATGGGIDNESKLTVINSTFSGNLVSGKQGGGGARIANEGKLTVTNSTFSSNKASGSKGFGGGIFFFEGSSAIIRFSTIYGNTSSAGGGIWVDPTGSSLISSSIIAANSASVGPDISGEVISDGYNLIENFAGAKGLNAKTDKNVNLADLKIDPTPGNNGGPTQTLALLQGSPAIDAVPLQACSITIVDASGHNLTITTDQRGDHRPDGPENACDIGAYESSY